MKFRFVLGFILLILVLVGIFIGLSYFLQIIKPNQFFSFFPTLGSSRIPDRYAIGTFPQPLTSTTTSTASSAQAPQVSMSVYRYGRGQISLRAPYFSGASINITGWKIKSEKKGETIIGHGYALAQVDATLSDVLLTSGESADIIMGLSPLAGNFRVNNCFGWLGNIYSIDYSISYCPRVALSNISGLDSQCQELVLQTSSCRAPADDVLNKQSSQCRIWVEKNLNYNACVSKHRSDSDFFKGWRIYTGNDNQVYDSLHDKIELRDRAGSLIDSYEY